jgi:hypothetical protein
MDICLNIQSGAQPGLDFVLATPLPQCLSLCSREKHPDAPCTAAFPPSQPKRPAQPD